MNWDSQPVGKLLPEAFTQPGLVKGRLVISLGQLGFELLRPAIFWKAPKQTNTLCPTHGTSGVI